MDYLLTLKHIFIDNNRYFYILQGLQFSLLVTLLSAVLGIVLGVISALLSVSHHKFLRSLSVLYTDVIRGTPVVVQLMILTNIIFIGVLRNIPILFVSALAFGINSGAYVSEIIRAGIQSVDKGQMDAAQALGMDYYTAMKEIIIPQAVRKILPPLVSELIMLLKETSVVGFIGGVDLLRAANIITSQTYRGIEPLLLVGIIYLMLTSLFTKLMRQMEKRLNING